MNNVQSSFAKSGIWPLNTETFNDSDYESAYVTDRPNPTNRQADPCNEAASENIVNNICFSDNAINDQTRDLITPDKDHQISYDIDSVTANINNDSISAAGPSGSLETILPFQKAGPRKSTNINRIRIKSTIYTDTPEKQIIEERDELRKARQLDKKKEEKC